MRKYLGNVGSFQDRNILLLEAAPKHGSKDWQYIPYENRVSAITPASKKFFEGMFLIL